MNTLRVSLLRSARFLLLPLALLAVSPAPVARAQESICVQVRIEIDQELTLERQGFEARMRIKNGSAAPLENLAVQVNFTDADGAPVVVTNDPNSTTALFFMRYAAGTPPTSIAPTGDQTLKWLIIPSPGAGKNVNGTQYFVGAVLTYTAGGEDVRIEVTPDAISVLPMPQLTLDYFLPSDVYGDDPFTTSIEPPIPFSLGVRVKNTGLGIAHHLKIESSQPKIIENELGLLIDFKIHGSEVNGLPYLPTRLIDFGDIQPDRSGVGRWTMTSSLYGKFIEFTASFSHADDLGGALTSLISEVNTHLLVRDVLIDLPGRDNVRDFLALDGQALRVYESENLDTDVLDLSSQATLGGGAGGTYQVTVPPAAGFSYVRVTDPTNGGLVVQSARRGDGKLLNLANAWQSKRFIVANRTWEYFLHILDANNTGGWQFTVTFGAGGSTNRAPVLGNPGDRIVLAGAPLTIDVTATDPDGTTPSLTANSLPTGAGFVDQGAGRGQLTWTPTVAQTGNFPVLFVASDGTLTDRETSVLTVTSGDLWLAWLERYFPGITDPAIIGMAADPDGDALSNLVEYALGGDPTKADPQAGPIVRVEEFNGEYFLTITFQKRTGDPKLSFNPVASHDLYAPAATWESMTTPLTVDQTGVPDGFTRVKFRDVTPIDLQNSQQPGRYAQLLITRAE